MLDAFIIEELKRREHERRRDDRRPCLEIPLAEDAPPGCEEDSQDDDEDSDRGVIIIDYRN